MAGRHVGIFFRLSTSTPVRLWAGVGDFDVPADAVETVASIYSGIGEVVGIPTIQQLINGVAERVSFTLSGVTPEIMQLADSEAADVRGSYANLGYMQLDGALQPLSAMRWLWDGTADIVQGSRSSNENGDVVRSISISIGTLQTNRRRPTFDSYTNANQQARSPTDRFCERVGLYSAGATKKWPS